MRDRIDPRGPTGGKVRCGEHDAEQHASAGEEHTWIEWLDAVDERRQRARDGTGEHETNSGACQTDDRLRRSTPWKIAADVAPIADRTAISRRRWRTSYDMTP